MRQIAVMQLNSLTQNHIYFQTQQWDSNPHLCNSRAVSDPAFYSKSIFGLLCAYVRVCFNAETKICRLD